MVVLQTILVFILVYYALKFGLKWFGPRILNYAVKKSQERFQERFGQQYHNNQQRTTEQGSTVSKKPFRKANPSKKVGEYIDFEEIE